MEDAALKSIFRDAQSAANFIADAELSDEPDARRELLHLAKHKANMCLAGLEAYEGLRATPDHFAAIDRMEQEGEKMAGDRFEGQE